MLLRGQRKVERCTAIGFSLGPHAPPVTMDDPPHVREPDTGAFEVVRAVEPLKDPEQLVRVLHVEADTIIPNEYDRIAMRIPRRADLDAGLRPRARVLHRIREQVDHDQSK